MTTDEKARAYDEALAHARRIYKESAGSFDDSASATIKVLEGLFPDLRDEMIRRDIVAVVEMNEDLTQGRKAEIYAYLENQKEKAQKPAEWSEEDKEMLNSAVKFVEHSAFSTIGKGKNNVLAWLKSLPERFNPQPKQEWSEEDEKILNLTKTQLRILQSHLSHKHSESMSDPEYSSRLLQIETCVSWLDMRLKSLRPCSSWKPSEEQMNALKAASTNPFWYGEIILNGLKSLYNDLQKLKQ
jgi:hypothetical protein